VKMLYEAKKNSQHKDLETMSYDLVIKLPNQEAPLNLQRFVGLKQATI